MQTTSIDQLAQDLIQAKKTEAAATAARVAIELEIIKHLGAREEGSETHALQSGLKVEIKGALNYKADMGMLRELASKLPADMPIIKVKEELDETGAKWIRKNAPDKWAIIAPAITIKPAKTSVSIKA